VILDVLPVEKREFIKEGGSEEEVGPVPPGLGVEDWSPDFDEVPDDNAPTVEDFSGKLSRVSLLVVSSLLSDVSSVLSLFFLKINNQSINQPIKTTVNQTSMFLIFFVKKLFAQYVPLKIC
jgi:hypothetical protein